MTYKTEQEEFWAGNFGNDYIDRNDDDRILAGNQRLFSRIMQPAMGVRSALELGCNIGLNLQALKWVDPEIQLQGVEINQRAAEVAAEKKIADIRQASIIDKLDLPKADLTFTKTVLIHINPEHLDDVYANLVRLSNRYVLVVEYYNPAPVTVSYRGNQERLFKRDFAGEIMDRHDLELVDYGFSYHRDRYFPQDDMTWFLMEK